MEQNSVFNLKNIKVVILITLIAVLITLGISFLQTPKYESSTKLITVFNQGNIDPYTAGKTSDYISNILSEVIYSNSFIDSVFKSQFHLKDTLGNNAETRAKNWKDMVKVQTKQNTGIINIDVYNTDRNQADQFSQAIAYTIINNGQLYYGTNDNVVIKVIDGPATTQNWAEPKIGRNAGLGLIAGLIVGLTFIFTFPEQQILKAFSIKPKLSLIGDENFELANNNINRIYPTQNNQTQNRPTESAPTIPTVPTDKKNDDQFYNW